MYATLLGVLGAVHKQKYTEVASFTQSRPRAAQNGGKPYDADVELQLY
jgi:hypothetical protein